MTLSQHVKNLSSHDHNLGRDSFKMLIELSSENDEIAYYIDDFRDLLQQDNSYYRIRGVRLLSENIKWLSEERVAELLPLVLERLNDEKPIVVRKVLEGLGVIMSTCPHTATQIIRYLDGYSYSKYSDAMGPVIEKDIAKIRDIYIMLNNQTDSSIG